MSDLSWSCRCGAMRGHLKCGPPAGTHVVCHCKDCVRAQRHFGVETSTQEGVSIFQTTPDNFAIDIGREHLALAQLSPKGLYRWYAKCCGTQLGATARTPKFSFVGVLGRNVADPSALGPVRVEGFIPQPDGGTKNKGTFTMVSALARRAVSNLISGRWRETPFFDTTTGTPVAKAELLPKDAGMQT